MIKHKVNFAIIGMGWVGTNRHLPYLMQNANVNLVGIIDRNKTKVSAAAKRFGIANTAVSVTAEASWMDHVDAVIVATPPMTHYALAKQLLTDGKHVLLEKPMSMSVAEGEELEQLAQTQNLVLSVVHNFQFARSILKLKRLITQGKLGEIQSIEGTQLSSHQRRLPSWYEDLPLGLFYDESPHLLYLLSSFSEDPLKFISAQVILSNKGFVTPSQVTAHFTSSHIPLRLTMNFESPLSEWHLIVLGSEYMAVVDIFRDILILLPSDKAHQAGNILNTSWHAIRSHLWGTLISGALMLMGQLKYGNDQVHQKFIKSIQQITENTNTSTEDGLNILRLQHLIISQASYEVID